jgi:hypothetical protein
MTITEKIEGIINARKGKLSGLEGRLEFLKKLELSIEHFSEFRKDVENNRNGKYKPVLDKNPDIVELLGNLPVDKLLQKIRLQMKELEFLITRFSRNNIQISVVGKAGQGKSRLLQSISGLTGDIIPDSKGTDCTGTKSVIYNDKNALHAKVIFYTETEMIEQVQEYLSVLSTGIRIGSISEIGRIDLNTIETKTSDGDSKKEHLKKYVNFFSSYKDNLGKILTIQEKQEIRKYVAQHDENGNPLYHYLAVKEVQIYTPFNYEDAGKIVLVDTIGLGDTSLRIQEKMISALTNDSDAGIVLRRPEPLRDNVHNEDNQLIDFIQSNMNGRSIDRWLFYILNVVNLPNNSNSNNVMSIKKELERKQQEGKLHTAFIKAVDCSNKTEVEKELLIPMLDILSQNLSQIDSDFMKKADDTGRELYIIYFSFLKDLQNVLVKDFRKDGNINYKINELFDEFFYTVLLGKLKEMCMEMYENRGIVCSALDERFATITTFNPDAKIPSLETIEQALRRGGEKGQPTYVYSEYVSGIRTNLTEEFIKIDESLSDVVDEFKKRIVELLVNAPRLGLIYPVDDDKHPKEWLLEFSNEILPGFEQLQFAFVFLYRFELSVRGFLMHKIRKHIDILDPDIPSQIPQFGSQPARSIRSELQGRLISLRGSLQRELRNFTQEPNEAFFAVIKEFYDRLAYSPDVEKEWRRLYYDNCAIVWKSEIMAEKDIQIAFDDCQKYINGIKEFNNKNQFILID